MTKKVLSFALLALMAITANSQHFDWVRSYFGTEYSNGYAANEIFSSVLDREGNLYILGHFIGDAQWDNNTEILPFPAHH